MAKLLEITGDDIAELNDSDLRNLIGLLSEADYRLANFSTSGILWGGHQNAPDGGFDVVVDSEIEPPQHSFIPRRKTGIQVKKPDMPKSKIIHEMKPGGILRDEIKKLIEEKGAYLIVSSSGSTSYKALEERKSSMMDAIKDENGVEEFVVDFYDRGRIASWVRQYPSLVLWVKNKIGRPIQGWYPYVNWSNPLDGIDEEYIVDESIKLINSGNSEKTIVNGIDEMRNILDKEKKAVRLIGLSGVGKTRFIQALFDERIGSNSLNPALVCYTDLSREPDPSAVALAEQLSGLSERVILVVDNCTPELHGELVNIIEADRSRISLLTVEYDVRDDIARETDVFKLEPNSLKVIEKIIEKRFEHIGQIDARSIAEFSGGNARVAIALAETVEKDDSLTGLRDEELFNRLFHQRNDSNENLMRSAEVLSLVYSFNGTETGEGSELAFLAELIGIQARDLYRDMQDLKRRNLIQVRGDWRAVLPQAISNRLAKKSFDSIPKDYIVSQFLESGSERLIKSFAHRLSFLHDSKVAIEIVEDWLDDSGWLGKEKCYFSSFGMDIFRNIAPVAPEKVLECIEISAESRGPEFLDPAKNNKSMDFVSLLRHIAYDPEYFDRAFKLIYQITIFEKSEGKYNTIEELLKSLFWILWSGTHAPFEQRAKIINELFVSKNDIEQKIGFSLLEASLETNNFSSHYSFDFGARPRDFGWQPTTRKEVSEWYQLFITMCTDLALSEHNLSQDARKLLADKFRDLWNGAGSIDLLEEVYKKLHDKEPWTEGWLAVKESMGIDIDNFTPVIEEKIISIEEYLRPDSLYEKARVHILPGHYYSSDCDEIDDDKEEIEKCLELLNKEVYDIGKKLAENKKIFLSLVSEMIVSDNHMLSVLVKGVASEYQDKNELWSLFYEQYRETAKEKWDLGALVELLSYWAEHEYEFFNELMEQLVDDKIFAEHFPRIQIIHLDANGIDRLHQAIDLKRAPLSRYKSLAYGRNNELLNDNELYSLLEHIYTIEDSLEIVIEILSMRQTLESQSSKLIDIGYKVLAEFSYEKKYKKYDHKLEIITKTCFESNPDKKSAALICKKIADNRGLLGTSNFYRVSKMIANYFPMVFLDCSLEHNFIVTKGIRSLSSSYDLKESNSIYDEIEDKYILEWCEEDLEIRHPFIASIINPLNIIDDNLVVKPLVYSILENTPNIKEVLENLLNSIMPWAYSSQRVETFDSKNGLLLELKTHENTTISEWAENELKIHLAEIEKNRNHKKDESKSRFERFE